MKQFRKRMIATGLAVSITLGSVQTLKVFASSDISDNYFAKAQIDKFISEGIIKGYPDGTFKPNNSITRAEFVKIINKAFGFTKVGTKSFKDIKEDAWYTNDIKIAVEKGYINGFEDNTFRPNEEITREQMAKILGVILNISGDGKTDFLDDSKIAPWAKKYVDGLADAKLISGYPDKTFNPKGNATRGESVSVISNGKDHFESTQKPEDNNSSTGGSNNGGSTGGSNNGGSTGGSNNGGSNNGGITGPGNGDVTDPGQGEVDADKTVSDANEVQNELNNANNTVVEYSGNTQLETINIPEGKTLVVSGNTEITGNIDVSKGTLIINGTVRLADGGKLTTTNAKTFSLAKEAPKVKIIGDGTILVNEGEIYLTDVAELDVDFEVTSKSKLQINDCLWLDGAKNIFGKALITIHDDNTTLKFDFNSTGDNIDYVTINGNVTLNDTFYGFVIKSANSDSMINLPNKKNNSGRWESIGATLYGIGDVKGGTYEGNGTNSWEKLDNLVTVKTSMEKTTSSTIIPGRELVSRIGVSRDTSKYKYNENTTITLLDYYSDPMNANVFDIDDVKEFRILINLGKDKLLTGIKFNGNSYDIEKNISDKIQPGDLVTINLRKDQDYMNIGLDKANLDSHGGILEFTGVECDAKSQEKQIDIQTSITTSPVSQMQSTTAGTITVEKTTTNSTVDTKVEVFVGDKSVTGFDMKDIIDNNNEVKVKISLGKDKTLSQVILNSHNLSELTSQTIEKGSVVTITLTKDELHELVWAQTDYDKFRITVVEK